MWKLISVPLSQVFPLDYILITVITMYFVLTSMAGIRNMGIWFFWMRVNKGPHFYSTLKLLRYITLPCIIYMNMTFLCSCTKLGRRKLVPRLFSSSVWFYSWSSFIPATWSTAWLRSTSCTAARSISRRWGENVCLSVSFQVSGLADKSELRGWGCNDGCVSHSAGINHFGPAGVGRGTVSTGWSRCF